MNIEALLADIRSRLDWVDANPVSEEHQALADSVRMLDGLLTCGDPIPADWQF